GTSSILELKGGAGAGYQETYTIAAGGGDPTIVTTNGTASQTVHATGLTAVLDSVPVDSMTWTAPASAGDVTVADSTLPFDGPAGPTGGPSTAINASPLTPLAFSGKTAGTVSGGRSVTVNNPPPADGLQSLTIDNTPTVTVWSTAQAFHTFVLDSGGKAQTVT